MESCPVLKPQQPEVAEPSLSFGRLLRFWRNVRGKSQEELSLMVDGSARHISFLETGRSQPGRDMAGKLAAALELGVRDSNNLLVAAGFTPQRMQVDLLSDEFRWLRKALEVTLLTPYPCHVGDPLGNVLMFNRPWLAMATRLLPAAELAKPLNFYRLFFSEQGFRPYIENWDSVACVLLMYLQQEVLLGNQQQGVDILHEMLAYPYVPDDWKQRAAMIEPIPCWRLSINYQGQSGNYLNTVNTLGTNPYVAEPRLLIHSIYPEEGDMGFEEWLEDSEGLSHPLLSV
jgi:transcriptional regulator with XRE-family HTH domain